MSWPRSRASKMRVVGGPHLPYLPLEIDLGIGGGRSAVHSNRAAALARWAKFCRAFGARSPRRAVPSVTGLVVLHYS
jgi:hypothetical protein